MGLPLAEGHLRRLPQGSAGPVRRGRLGSRGSPSLCLSQHAHTHRLDVTAALGASGDARFPVEDDSLCAGKQHHIASRGVSGRGTEGSG